MFLNHGTQWENQLGINHSKVMNDDVVNVNDTLNNSIRITMNNSFDEAAPTPNPKPSSEDLKSTKSPQRQQQQPKALYKILRSLPNYRVGEPLSKSDMILVYSKEATAYAMNKLRPDDCAFILRSDGKFTYSIYEGHPRDDPNSLSFRVDRHGRFKVLPLKQFLSRVKVPVLPMALMGNKALVSKYLKEDEKEEEEKKEAEDNNEEVCAKNNDDDDWNIHDDDEEDEESLKREEKKPQEPEQDIMAASSNNANANANNAAPTMRRSFSMSSLTLEQKSMASDEFWNKMLNEKMARRSLRRSLQSRGKDYGDLDEEGPGDEDGASQDSGEQRSSKEKFWSNLLATKLGQKDHKAKTEYGEGAAGHLQNMEQHTKQPQQHQATASPEDPQREEEEQQQESHQGSSDSNSRSLPRSTMSMGNLRSSLQRESSESSASIVWNNLLAAKMAQKERNDQAAGRQGQPQQQPQQQRLDSKDIFSKMTMASGTAGSIRVASMQNFRQSVNNLKTVPETPSSAGVSAINEMFALKRNGSNVNNTATLASSSTLLANKMSRAMTMNTLNAVSESSTSSLSNEAFALKRDSSNGNAPSLAPSLTSSNNLMTALANNNNPMSRAVSTGQFHQSGNMLPRNVTLDRQLGSFAGTNGAAVASNGGANASWEVAESSMPRNVTVQRLSPGGVNAGTDNSGGNASWEVAGSRSGAATMKDNPLLRMANQLSQQQEQQAAENIASNVTSSSSTTGNGHPFFSLGDQVQQQDLPLPSTEEMKMALMISKLKVGDNAFVKRSGGSYSYAQVKQRSFMSITFVVNDHGDVKSFDLLNAGKYVRIVEEDTLEEMAKRVATRTSAMRDGNGASLPRSDAANENENKSDENENHSSSKKDLDSLRRRRTKSEEEDGNDSNHLSSKKDIPSLQRRRRTTMGESSGLSSMPSKSNRGNKMPRASTNATLLRRRRGTMGNTPAPPLLQRNMSDSMYRNSIVGVGSACPVVPENTANAEWDLVPNTEASASSSPHSSSMTSGKSSKEYTEETPSFPSSHMSTETGRSNNTNTFKRPQLVREDSKRKVVQMFKPGKYVYYKKDDDDDKIFAKILKVQLDDNLEPYYTIQLEDGREVQTDNDHIELEE